MNMSDSDASTNSPAEEGGGGGATVPSVAGKSPDDKIAAAAVVVSTQRKKRVRKSSAGVGRKLDYLSSGRPFKRAKKRLACHEKMQRKMENDCFGIGLMQLEQETIATVLNCKDRVNPSNKEEATAIHKLCLYGNYVVPNNVYAQAKEVTLNPKYVYSSMPSSESKERCLAFARSRDEKFGLLRSVDKDGNVDDTAKGGMSDLADVAETRIDAEKHGFPFNTRAEDIPDPPTKKTLSDIILGQKTRLVMLKRYAKVAMKELNDHMAMYQEEEEKDQGFVAPKHTNEFLELSKMDEKQGMYKELELNELEKSM